MRTWTVRPARPDRRRRGPGQRRSQLRRDRPDRARLREPAGPPLSDVELSRITSVRSVADLLAAGAMLRLAAAPSAPNPNGDLTCGFPRCCGTHAAATRAASPCVTAGATCRWREFARDVDATANRLLDLPAGSRVLVLAATGWRYLETYVACAAAGMVAAPVNPALTAPELAYLVAAVEPRVAVADAAGRLRLARSHPALPTITIEELADLPSAPPYLPGDRPGRPGGDPAHVGHHRPAEGRGGRPTLLPAQRPVVAGRRRRRPGHGVPQRLPAVPREHGDRLGLPGRRGHRRRARPIHPGRRTVRVEHWRIRTRPSSRRWCG